MEKMLHRILIVFQMSKMVSPMTSVMWQAYIGTFLAAFIVWASALGMTHLVLLLIGVACAMAGGCLRFLKERGSLFRATQEPRAEIALIVEQERSRISKDLHDVLADSLTVIAALADGTRYSHPGQPEAVLTSLKNISQTARTALVDVQQVSGNAPGPRVTP